MLMSKPKAWREVARMFVEDSPQWGLCNRLSFLLDRERISYFTFCEMDQQINEYLRGRRSPWAYRISRTGSGCRPRDREARALAALWLALECEHGEDEC